MLREVKVFKNLPKSSVKPIDFLNLKIDIGGDASGRRSERAGFESRRLSRVLTSDFLFCFRWF